MMRAISNRLATLLLTGAGLAAPHLAAAQQAEPDPNVTVQSRSRPEFDPIGIRLGSFFVYPEITLGGLYDDNTRATKNNADTDFALTVTPAVKVESNFSRHKLQLEAGGDLAFYQDDSDLDYQDVYLQGSGQLDITRDNLLIGQAGVSRLHEDPSSPDARNGGRGSSQEVTKYWRDTLNLNYRHNFARFYTQVGGEVTRFDFRDNNDINEDDRDRNQYLVRLRGGYEISPRFTTFLQGTADIRRYDNTPDDGGIDRNSQGYSLRAGTEIDITGIMFGELSAGYDHRTYNDNSLDSVNGLGFGAKLTWNITPLTTILLNGAGEVQETTVVDNGNRATADFQKTVGLDITHELLRNLLLNANAGYVRDDFEGISRSDDTFLLGAGVTYLLNRNLALEGTYRFSDRNSDESSEEYSRNIFRIGITARL